MQWFMIIIQVYYAMGFSHLEVVMKRLLDEGKYADLTISCPGREFKGHRAISCSQSPFFDAALNGGFRVSRFLDWVVAVMVLLLIVFARKRNYHKSTYPTTGIL
jgi:hypothetical protein